MKANEIGVTVVQHKDGRSAISAAGCIGGLDLAFLYAVGQRNILAGGADRTIGPTGNGGDLVYVLALVCAGQLARDLKWRVYGINGGRAVSLEHSGRRPGDLSETEI